MLRIEDAANLFLVFPDPARKFVVADAGWADGLEHRKLGRNSRLNRNRHQSGAPVRLRARQRQTPCRIGEQCETERLLGLCVGVSFVVALCDRLRHVRKADDNAMVFTGLEPGMIYKRPHGFRLPCGRVRACYRSSRPSAFKIFFAVLGSISRDGSVLTLSPTQIIACPPFPRHTSCRNVTPLSLPTCPSGPLNLSRF